MIKKTLPEWAKTIGFNDKGGGTSGGSTKEMPNALLKVICESHHVTKFAWGNENDIVAIMKFFGLSKEEAIQLLLTNASASTQGYVPLTMEILTQKKIWSLLENYDQENAV